MWQIIRDLAAAGVTVFLTTQYLDEADKLADRVAVLDHGSIVVEGTTDELKARISGGHIRLQFADPHHLNVAAAILGAVSLDDDALALRVPGAGTVESLRTLLDRLDANNLEVEQLSIQTPDLDDVFFTVTGHPSVVKAVAP